VTTDHSSAGGVSWVDFEGDGDLDLYVTNGYDVSTSTPTGQFNRLYLNEGGGVLVEAIAEGLTDGEEFSSSSTWADYDNDGDLDVFICTQQDLNNHLMRNEGDGLFMLVDGEPVVSDGGHSYTAAWVDVDNDGWLDLFVANGGLSHTDTNDLYRGTGDGHFEKITEGCIVTDEAATCGIAWGDYDNDGDLDLFVANQGFAPPANNNALYRNDGDWVFTPIEDVSVVNDGQPSCAATWVDVDNDLDLDLHVANMYGLADRLYLNDGQGALSPAEGLSLTLDGGHSYGANWEDYDNDGDLDVVVANWGASPAVHLNDGQGGFEQVIAGELGDRLESPGAMASGDFDGDGDVDVYVGNWPNLPGPDELNALYSNDTEGRHWLRVRLRGETSNGSSVGARVVLTSRQDGQTITQMREITTQMGFRGQSDLNPHFGLGETGEIVSLEVQWPSGKRSILTDITADQIVEVTEP